MFKRICCFLLALILFLPALTLAELEEEDLGIEDLEVEEFDPEAEVPSTEAKWDFPVALEDMNPEFVVLANKHYKLDSEICARTAGQDEAAQGLTRTAAKKRGRVLCQGRHLQTARRPARRPWLP